jgi:hypothetical protein
MRVRRRAQPLNNHFIGDLGIKKHHKILLILALVLVGLPFLVSLIFMFPGIQTRLVDHITQRLSHDLNTEISIGRVRALPFSGIRLDDFLVRDLQADTLLFAPRVHAEVDYFSMFKKHIYLGRVRFDNPTLNVSENDAEMNFTFLIDSIGKLKPDTVKWNYSVRGVDIRNGNISFHHSILENPSFQRDHFLFEDLSLQLTRVSTVNKPLYFRLNRLTMTEKSGLSIEGAGANGRIRSDKLQMEDFYLKTVSSEIEMDLLEFMISPDQNPGNTENRFHIVLSKMMISLPELGLIFNNIPDIGKPFVMSGEISGNMDNLKGRNINASLGTNTRLSTSVDLTGLNDFSETFIFMDVKNLQSDIYDLNQILTGLDASLGTLPPTLNALGLIKYSGNLTGFFKDLVAYGTFHSALGSVSTDISMKLEENEAFSFDGVLSTEGFRIGEFVNARESMGGISMEMKVNGDRKSNIDYSVQLEGNVEAFEWNDYTYRDVEINGLYTHQRFDGSVEMIDPNGVLRFDGEIDGSGAIPHFRFNASLERMMPDRLNILPRLKDGVLTLSVAADFEGVNIDDMEGKIGIYDGLIYTPETTVGIDSMTLTAFRDGAIKKILLKSDFVEGELSGNYNFGMFRKTFLDMVSHFLPSVAAREPRDDLPLNRFNFQVSFKDFDRLVGLFLPGLEMADNGMFKGNVDSEKHLLDIEAGFDHIRYKGFNAGDVEFYAKAQEGTDLNVVTRVRKIEKGNMLSLYNFSIIQKAGRDTLGMNVFWNNWHEVTNSGAIYTNTVFDRRNNNDFNLKTRLQPSTVILEDSVWQLSEANALYGPDLFSIRGLEISHKKQRLAVDGFLHRESMDGLRVEMDNLDLFQFFDEERQGAHSFGGIVDGSIEVKDYFRVPRWTTNFSVDDFCFDGDTIGLVTVGSRWDRENEVVSFNTSVSEGDNTPLVGKGYMRPEDNTLDVELDLDGLKIDFLRTFIGKILQNLDANASGKLFLTGPVNKPYLTGKVKIDRGKFDVDLLETSYSIRDSVWFYPNEIRFKDMTVVDRHGHEGNFRGSIYHEGFMDMVYNLHLDINNMLVLDTRVSDNPYYYGTVYGDGNMSVTGTTRRLELNIEGATRNNTRFFIPMGDTEEAIQSNFIRFVSKDQNGNTVLEDDKSDDRDYKVDVSGMALSMEIDVTPEARIQIIFDAAMGDLLSANGEGNMQIYIDRQGNISLFGDYNIEQGEYLFSLQNLVNKRFNINEGGIVSWQGNPNDARINLTAVYKLKAPLSDLIGPMADVNSSGDANDIQRRIPINCNLMLNGALDKPGIKFGIEAPTLTESRESYMLDFISSEDEMNRQVLSLLVLNRFYTPDYLRMGSDPGMQPNNAALVTTTEMLSNQLSRWLSNISSDVDVGVSYRPEDNISSEEIELALSTRMFNNRVTINGNIGYGRYQTNTSKMVGDFDMDVRLNPSGTIRAKVYTRSNDDIIYETSPTTQGVGISFREEFDSIKDLWQKYWNAISGKNNKSDEDNSKQ